MIQINIFNLTWPMETGGLGYVGLQVVILRENAAEICEGRGGDGQEYLEWMM